LPRDFANPTPNLQIQRYLPEEYIVLLKYINELPAGVWSPCHPFAGFVINFGVATDAHIDKEDLYVCVVITFGDFRGGQLGLYEAKILLEMEGFHICFFPSDRFTHFNFPFQGQRGSISLSTEKASKHWVQFRNHWSKSMYGKTV
jgi:hypothetical protein